MFTEENDSDHGVIVCDIHDNESRETQTQLCEYMFVVSINDKPSLITYDETQARYEAEKIIRMTPELYKIHNGQTIFIYSNHELLYKVTYLKVKLRSIYESIPPTC